MRLVATTGLGLGAGGDVSTRCGACPFLWMRRRLGSDSETSMATRIWMEEDEAEAEEAEEVLALLISLATGMA